MSFEYVAYDSRRNVYVKHSSQMTSLGLPQRPYCDQNVANAFLTTFTPRRSYALVTGLQRGSQGYGGKGGVRQLLMPCLNYLPNRLSTSSKHEHENCFHGASKSIFQDGGVGYYIMLCSREYSAHRNSNEVQYTPQNRTTHIVHATSQVG